MKVVFLIVNLALYHALRATWALSRNVQLLMSTVPLMTPPGFLITKLNPKRICVHALSALSGPIIVANELFYAGVDPNEMRLNRVGCFDVGIHCGGWGQIVLEVKIEDRK